MLYNYNNIVLIAIFTSIKYQAQETVGFCGKEHFEGK